MHNTHVHHTKGGLFGHVFRRLIHVGMVAIPFWYYYLGNQTAALIHLSRTQLMLLLLVLNVFAEALRLILGLKLLGHRHYEGKRISSFAWGFTAIFIVLQYSPGPSFAMPIIWSCAIGDPLLGELRHTMLPLIVVLLIAIVVIMLSWWVATWVFATAWWWALIMGPVAVAAEWPSFKWIDDNALMLLIPFGIVMLFAS